MIGNLQGNLQDPMGRQEMERTLAQILSAVKALPVGRQMFNPRGAFGAGLNSLSPMTPQLTNPGQFIPGMGSLPNIGDLF